VRASVCVCVRVCVCVCVCESAEALREVKSHKLDEIQHEIIGGASHVTIANEFHKNGAACRVLKWLQTRVRQVQALSRGQPPTPTGQLPADGLSAASISLQVNLKPHRSNNDNDDDDLDPTPHEPDTLMERALP
jgi:hypothetical protein